MATCYDEFGQPYDCATNNPIGGVFSVFGTFLNSIGQAGADLLGPGGSHPVTDALGNIEQGAAYWGGRGAVNAAGVVGQGVGSGLSEVGRGVGSGLVDQAGGAGGLSGLIMPLAIVAIAYVIFQKI